MEAYANEMYMAFYFSILVTLIIYGEITSRAPRMTEHNHHWCKLYATLAFFGSGLFILYWFGLHVTPPFSTHHAWVSGWVLALWLPMDFILWASIVLHERWVSDEETFLYMERRHQYPADELRALLSPYGIRRFPVDDYELGLGGGAGPACSPRDEVERYVRTQMAAFDRVLRRAQDAQYQHAVAQYKQLTTLCLDVFTGRVCEYEKWRQLNFNEF
jgi:hypothetical protein